MPSWLEEAVCVVRKLRVGNCLLPPAKQSPDTLQQSGKFVADNCKHPSMVDLVVSVGDQITKRDDLRQIGNFNGDGQIRKQDSTSRLADNLELSLDR